MEGYQNGKTDAKKKCLRGQSIETQAISGKHLLLTHWGWVMHICLIGSDNGLSTSRHQAIIWTKAGILLIGPLGTNFNEILVEIYIFSFKKMHLKMSSILSWPQSIEEVDSQV